MRTVSVVGAVLLVFGRGGALCGSVPAEVEPGVALDALEHFNLPAHFEHVISDRKLIDDFQKTHYRVETSQRPTPEGFMTVRNRNPRYVRSLTPQYSSDVLAYWQGLPDRFVPVRNFRAPILDRRLGEGVGLTNTNAKHCAAEWIARRLAHDGLLLTLAHVIELLGPDTFVASSSEGMTLLQQVGFPTDLLDCFPMEGGTTAWIAKKLRDGMSPKDLKEQLAAVTFRFARSASEFQLATECGETELGLLRMQVDGGYENGILPGGNIDVICHAVAALPNVDSIISLPREQLQAFEWLARNWRLRHTNQVTLIAEPLLLGAWAQDNGKAGLLSGKPATLTPRYASQDEGRSYFKKAESFLMNGLRTAGHEVAHSRLLFQGGNLLAVRDPKTGQRILLVNEGEIHRNRALGLTTEQIEEAFRVEFDVDRCVTVPAASYHLDFDVTVRAQGDRLVAFVNDTHAAAREIVQIGIGALERGGILSSEDASAARANLVAARDEAVVKQLSEVLRKARNKNGAFTEALAKSFVVDKMDSAEGNLQTFLLGLDVMESTLPSADAGTPRQAYLQALRRMSERCQAQQQRLRDLGWTVVTMPSMIDLFRSVNYLNGVHYKGGYLMPVFGGLYAPLDKMATARFQAVTGPEVRIQPIRSADSQRHHGGVHCVVAAYPKI